MSARSRERILVSTGRGGFKRVTRGSKEHKAIQCKARGGHHFADGYPDVCAHCGTRRPPSNTFARLAFLKWWDDSMRRMWQQIGVEMVRPLARDLLRRVVSEEVVIDETSYRGEPVATFIAAAMVDHKLRHPRARGDRMWTYRNPTGRGRGDVACRFCGRILLMDKQLGLNLWSAPDVVTHTTECAITTLATNASADPARKVES